MGKRGSRRILQNEANEREEEKARTSNIFSFAVLYYIICLGRVLHLQDDGEIILSRQDDGGNIRDHRRHIVVGDHGLQGDDDPGK